MFDQQVPIGGQRGVDLGRGLQIALEGVGEMLLTGKVRAIADPQRQRLRAQCFPDADAIEVVGNGLFAHGRIGVGQAAEFVGQGLAALILEGVGIDRVEPQAQRTRARAERLRVSAWSQGKCSDTVGSRAAQRVDDRAVFEFLEDVARLAGARKARETRAARADAPGRDRRHGSRPPRCVMGSIVRPRRCKLHAERIVVGLRARRAAARSAPANEIRIARVRLVRVSFIFRTLLCQMSAR